MILIKYAVIIMLVVLVLAPLAIRLMLGLKHSFRNQRKMVNAQYPSLFHNNHREDRT